MIGCFPSTTAPRLRNTAANSARGSTVAPTSCRSSHFAIFSASTLFPHSTPFSPHPSCADRFGLVPLLVRHGQVASLPMWNLFFHRCCLLSLADFTFLFEPEHVFADFFRVCGRV